MDVQLYVYDLSKGMARQFSRQFLGTYIEGVWHTAIVMQGIEYFFGAGVQTTYAGSTHHGQPMQMVPLGKTELPMEVIVEYLDSLKQVYTAESYDLFMHNCNNFSNDFAMFLVGKGIPDHITSLPQTVLNTPFGMMLRPQLDQAMRGITQAPVAPIPAPAVASSLQGFFKGEGKGYTLAPHHPHTKIQDKLLAGALDRQVSTTLRCNNMPTLEKLIAKLGEQGKDPAVVAIRQFLVNSHSTVPQNSRVPALPDFSTWLDTATDKLPLDSKFAAYDLFRLALADDRISAYYAEDSQAPLVSRLLQRVNGLEDECPYNLRVVTLQMVCNLLASKLAQHEMTRRSELCSDIIALTLASSLDDNKGPARTAAAKTAVNLAAANFRSRLNKRPMSEEQEVELLAGLLSALDRESDEEAERVRLLTSAIGLLIWFAPVDGGIADLCQTMEASDIVQRRLATLQNEKVIQEVYTLVSHGFS